MSYATPHLTPVGRVVPLDVIRAAFAALGEPLDATFTPGTIAELAAARGLSVLSDEGAEEWQRAAPVPGRPWGVFSERLAVLGR